MHDCRFLSDYLYHRYQVFLQSVWDTQVRSLRGDLVKEKRANVGRFQVARVVVYKKKHLGDIPRFVDSLPKTLEDTLGVDPNKLPFLWYRSYAMEVRGPLLGWASGYSGRAGPGVSRIPQALPLYIVSRRLIFDFRKTKRFGVNDRFRTSCKRCWKRK